MTRWFLPLLLLSACAVSEEAFPEKAAESLCERLEECGELESSLEDCIAVSEGTFDAFVRLATGFGGEYDAGEAGRCVREIRRMPCDEVDDWETRTLCGDVVQ